MNNMQRLGEVFIGREQRAIGANKPTAIELGTINSNLSLSTDSLQSPIPKGDYMVDIRLYSSSYNTSSTTHTHSGGNHSGHESGDGSHSHSGGSHSHQLPDAFRKIKAGDRVLVAWCGNDPVVIAIVVSS